MIDQKALLGIMNLDDKNENIPQGHHKDARNIDFRGPEGDLRAQATRGMRSVTNPFLPAGNNINIYSHYDQVKKRVFEFNFNEDGLDAIFIYDVATETYQVLLQVGAATDGNILNFDLDTALCNVDIVYGDENAGDILTFLDTLQRPTAIGINKFLNNPYTLTKRVYIDLAKSPPAMTPQVTYENDDVVAVNNCKNSLFQFSCFHEDVNNFRTFLSTGSIVPLPFKPFDIASDTDTSKNARIAVYLPTGDVNMRKIGVVVSQTNANTTVQETSQLLVTILDKDELGIADNDVYKYEFLNDALYPALDPKFTTPTQSFVPSKAVTQTLLRGNVITFGNITDGLDLPEADVDGSVTNELFPYTTLNGLLFFANQTGLTSGGTGDTITVYLTGTGTNTANEPTTLNNSQAIYKVDARNAAGSSVAFQYDNVTQVETVSNIFDGISAAAVIAGWTELSRTGNTMTLQYSTDVTLLGNGIIRSGSTSLADSDVLFVYAPESNYTYGIVYGTSLGKKSSVLTDIPYNIVTPVESSTEMPLVQLEINHRPPLYADRWWPVRSPNLTYGKRLDWISFAAYTGIISVNNEQYAYIDIQNIATYNLDIKSTANTVKYDFAPGDRIRFKSRVEFNGTLHPLTGKDYEILGVVTSITLADSTKKIGTFIQIRYPTSDISADFAFDGSFDFMNYEILLYNYTQHASREDTSYFEFGKQFGICNAGTVNAYHIGQEQSQTANLSQPAIVTTYEGDYFLRKRLVPTGMSYEHTLVGYENGWDDYTTIPIEVPDAPVVTPYYEINTETFQNAGLGAGDYPTYADTPYYYNSSSDTERIHIQTKIVFTNDVSLTAFEILAKIDNTVPLAPVTVLTVYPNTGFLQANVEHTAEIDTVINVPRGGKLSLIMHKTGSKVWVTSTKIKFDVLNQKLINIVEDTFSDVYGIKTTSNSKPSVVDKNAQETTFQNSYRWSQMYNPGTNNNELNVFYAADEDITDLSSGSIQRMVADGNKLEFYLERAIGATGIYAKFIQDSTDKGTLTTTDEIISKNNIQYYQGEWGIGLHPESVIRSDNARYIVDSIRGRELRIAADGVTDLTKLYKGQYVISPMLAKYNKDWTTASGGKAMIKGTYDFYEERSMRLLQAGVNGEDSIDANLYGFDEKRNGFSCFFDYSDADFILSVEEKMHAWKNGVHYILDNETTYCNFFGVQFFPTITLVFNKNKNIKQVFDAIAYQGDQIWSSSNAGDIITSMVNPQTNLRQMSELKEVDYEIQENIRYAAFLRDSNSMLDAQVALVEGDYLIGEWLQIKLTTSWTGFSYFYLPYILTQSSPRNY